MLVQDDNFTAAELGLEELNPYIAVNISEDIDEAGESTGNVYVYVTVGEDYRFHRELDGTLFGEDGRPTEQAEQAMESLLTERYNAESIRFEDDFFEFDMVLMVPATTKMEDLGVKIWEDTDLVKFHNEIDPGTFGSQYLFGSLIRYALAAAAAAE